MSRTKFRVAMSAIMAVFILLSVHLVNAYCGPDVNGKIYCDGVRVISNPLPTAFTEFVDEYWTPTNPALYNDVNQLIVPTASYDSYTFDNILWYFNFTSPLLSTRQYYFSLTQADYPIPNVDFGDPYRLDVIVDRTIPIAPDVVSGYSYESNGVLYFNTLPTPVVLAEAGSTMLVYIDSSLSFPDTSFGGEYNPVAPTSFEQPVTIELEPNVMQEVILSSYDMLGNSQNASFRMFWDSILPVIEFSPGDGAVVGDRQPVLEFAIAESGSGIDSDSIYVTVSNDDLTLVCDYPDSCDDFDDSYQDGVLKLVPLVDLNIAAQTQVNVDISVSDFAGNIAGDNYEFSIDTNTAYISEYELEDGKNYVSGPYTTVESPLLNVTFDSGVSLSDYSINTGSIVLLENTSSHYQFEVTGVGDANYLLSLTANKLLESGLGPESNPSESFIIDTTPPSVQIQNSMAVIADEFELAVDITEKNIKNISIFVNDILVQNLSSIPGYNPVTGTGTLYYTINLSEYGTEGSNTIFVNVTDKVTLTGSDSVVMILDTADPYIRNILPEDDSMVTTQIITVTGEAEYGSTIELFNGVLSQGTTTVRETESFDVSIQGTDFVPESLVIPIGSSVTITNANPQGSIPVEITYGDVVETMTAGQSFIIDNIDADTSVYVESTTLYTHNDTLLIEVREPNDDFAIENVELNPGVWNDLRFVVTDLSGRSITQDHRIYYDASEPTVTFSTPKDNAKFGQSEVTVIANLVDDFGLNHDSVIVYSGTEIVDDYEYEILSDSTARVTYSSSFIAGTHDVTVQIQDSAGNLGSNIVNFEIDSSLPSTPAFIIAGVQNPSFTTETLPSITIRFDRDVDFSDVSITPSVPFGNETGGNSINLTLQAPLIEEEFTISLKAKYSDVEGAEFGGPYTHSFIVDETNPVLAITAPEYSTSSQVNIDYSWVDENIDYIEFSGDVTPNPTVIELSENSGSATSTIFLTGQNQDNVITATLVDKAGLTDTEEFTIMWDNTPPSHLNVYELPEIVRLQNLVVDGDTDPTANRVSFYLYDLVGLVNSTDITNINPAEPSGTSYNLRADVPAGDSVITFTDNSCDDLVGSWLQFGSNYVDSRERYLVNDCVVNNDLPWDVFITVTIDADDGISQSYPVTTSVYSFSQRYPSGYFSGTVLLKEGVNTLYAIAYDDSSNEKAMDSPVTVILDTIPPTITDTHPDESELVSTNDFTIHATIDGTGSNPEIVSFTLDTEELTGYSLDHTIANTYDLTVVASVDSVHAVHTVYLQVRDEAGNLHSVTWDFTADPTAPTGPEFVVENAQGSGNTWYLSDTNLNVSWNYSDNETINLSAVSFNGAPLTINDYTTLSPYSFSYQTTVSEGPQYLTVTARKLLEDGVSYGLASTTTLTVHVDSLPPSISEWPDDDLVTQSSFVASLTTNEDANCGYAYSNQPYAQMIPFTTSSGTSHSTTIDLFEGRNNLFFLCEDLAGNTMTSPRLTVIDYDNTPPYLDVDYLYDNMETTQGYWDVTGSAEYGSTVQLWHNIDLLGSDTIEENLAVTVSVTGVEFEVNNIEAANGTRVTIQNTNPSSSIPLEIVYDDVYPLAGGESWTSPVLISDATFTVRSSSAHSVFDTLSVDIRPKLEDFSIPGLSLRDGENHLHFTVTDLANHITERDMMIFYDGTQPVITLLNPEDGGTYGLGTVQTVISFSDTGVLDEDSIRVTIDGDVIYANGQPASLYENGVLTYSDSYDVDGSNHIIRAEASDSLGNTNVSIWSFSIDGSYPSLGKDVIPGLTKLDGNFIINTTQIDFMMLYNEPVQVRTNDVNPNIDYWETLRLLDMNFSYRAQLGYLPSTSQCITFDARLLGIEGSPYGDGGSICFVGDATAPLITTSAPSITASATVNIPIEWFDPHMKEILFVGDVVSFSGVPSFTDSEGNFSESVTLANQDANNAITLIARDYAGNQYSEVLNIFWDNTPPQNLELFPVDSPYNMRTLTLQGITDSDVSRVAIDVYRSDNVGDINNSVNITSISGISTQLGSLTIRDQPKANQLSLEEDSCTGLEDRYIQHGQYNPQVGRWLVLSCEENGVVDNYITVTLDSAPGYQISGALTYHDEPIPSGFFEGDIPLMEGMNYIFATAYDSAGGSVSIDDFMTVQVDSVDPIISGLQPFPESVTNGQNVRISVLTDGTGTDIATRQMLLDDTEVSVGEDMQYIADDLTAGVHWVSVTVSDSAGNYKNELWNFTVDPTAPGAVEFNVTNGTNHGDTYQWYLNQEKAEIRILFDPNDQIDLLSMSFDGSSVSDYISLSPSVYQYTTLISDGHHELDVTASRWLQDASEWGTPVTYTLNIDVDSTIPHIINFHPVSIETNDNPVQVEIQASESAICRFATSDINYAEMSDVTTTQVTLNQHIFEAPAGTTTYYYKCADLAGNIAPETEMSMVTYDNGTPPLNEIYDPAKDLIPGCELSVSGTSEYGAQVTLDVLGHDPFVETIEQNLEYYVSLTGGEFSPGTLSTPEGSTLTLTNTDNLHAYTVSERFARLPTRTLQPGEDVTYVLVDGSYTFDVILFGEADNFVLDTLVVHTSKRIDNFNFGPIELLYKSPRPNAIQISALDTAGNLVEHPFRYVICDDQNPTVELVSPIGRTHDPSPTIVVNVQDEYSLAPDTIMMWVDDVDVTSSILYNEEEGTVTYNAPANLITDGELEKSVSVRVTVEDEAGNPTDETMYFTIDLRSPTAPTFLIDGLVTDYAIVQRPLITVDFGSQTVDIESAGFTNAPTDLELVSNFANRTFTYQPVDDLENGREYEFEVTGTLQNSGGISDSFSTTFTVDTTPPQINILTPDLSTRFQTVTVSGTCNDNIGVSRVVIVEEGNEEVEVDCVEGVFSLDYVLLEIVDSVHETSVTATAYDEAGLSSTDSMIINLDTESPSFELSVSPDPAGQELVTITVSASESLEGVPTITVDTTDTTYDCSGAGPFTCSYLVPDGYVGLIDFLIQGTDLVGNTGQATIQILADALEPSVDNYAPIGYSNDEWAEVSASYSDQSSGVGIDDKLISITIDGTPISELVTQGASADISGSSFTFIPAIAWSTAEHSVSMTLADNVGNTMTHSWTFNIDPNVPARPALSIVNSVVGSDERLYLPQTDVSFALAFDAVDNIEVSDIELDETPLLDSCTVSDNVWSCSSDVADESEHSITVQARRELPDGSFSNIATYEYVFIVDTVSPVIDALPLDTLVGDRVISLKGQITDYSLASFTASGPLESSPLSISAYESSTPVDYTQEGYLTGEDGVKVITLYAVDEAGNTATAYVSTRLDTSIPNLVVEKLESPTQNSEIAVLGQSEAQAMVHLEVPSSGYSGSYLVGEDHSLREITITGLDFVSPDLSGQSGQKYLSVPDNTAIRFTHDDSVDVVRISGSDGTEIILNSGESKTVLMDSTGNVGFTLWYGSTSYATLTVEVHDEDTSFIFTQVPLRSGNNLLRVWAEDTVTGIVTPYYEQTVYYDIHDPIIGELQPQGTTNNVKIPLTVPLTDEGSGIDTSTIEFIVDGVTYTVEDDELSYADGVLTFMHIDGEFSTGYHSVFVRAADLAGRLSERGDFGFTIDLTVPTIYHDINGWIYSNNRPTLTFTFDYPVTITHIDINGNDQGELLTNDSLTFEFTPDWNLPDYPAQISLYIQARRNDNLGSPGTYGPIVFGVDSTAPVVSVSPVTPNPRAEASFRLIGSVLEEDLQRIEFSGDIEPIQPILNPTDNSFNVPAVLTNEGTNTIRVTAYDKYRSHSSDIVVVLDTVSPQLSMIVVPNPAKAGSVLITVDSNEAFGEPASITVDNKFVCERQETPFICTYALSAPAIGQQTVRAQGPDSVGNNGYAETSLVVDTSRPTITGMYPTSWSDDPQTDVTAYIDDVGTGIDYDNIVVKINTASPESLGAVVEVTNNLVTISNDEWPTGEYDVVLTVPDYAGNKFTEAWTFGVDPNGPPVPSVTVSESINSLGVQYTSTTSPIIDIVYDTQDEIDVSSVVLLGDGNQELNCSTIGNVLSCPANDLRDENAYQLRITSRKLLGGTDYSVPVTHSTDFIVDTQVPVIELDNPDLVVGDTSYLITGQYRDYSLASLTISGDIAEGSVNIQAVPGTSLSGFSQEVTLLSEDGEKNITVRATDYAGLVTEETFTVVLDSTLPPLVLDELVSPIHDLPYLATGTSEVGAEVNLHVVTSGYNKTVVAGVLPASQDVEVRQNRFTNPDAVLDETGALVLDVPIGSSVDFVHNDGASAYDVIASDGLSFTLTYPGQRVQRSFDAVGSTTFELESLDTTWSTLIVNVLASDSSFAFNDVQLVPGPNMLVFQARDGETGLLSEPISEVVIYDQYDPIIENPSPSGYIADSQPVISVRITDIDTTIVESTIVLVLDGEEFDLSDSRIDYENSWLTFILDEELDNGTHSVLVSAKDESGRSSELPWQFTIDRNIPLVTDSPQNKYYSNNMPELVVEFGEDVIIDYFTLDSGNPKANELSSASRSVTYQPDDYLAEGEHLLSFGASRTDGTGLPGHYGPYSFYVDTQGPQITVSEVASPRSDTNVTLIISSNEDLNFIAIQGDIVDGKDIGGISTRNYEDSVTLTPDSATKTITIQGYDVVLNPSNLVTLNVVLDRDGPQPLWTNISGNDTPLTAIDILFAEDVNVLSYELDGPETYKDSDSDGVLDSADNCPLMYNPSQTDLDRNDIGDMCEGFYESESAYPIFLTKISDSQLHFTTGDLKSGEYLLNMVVSDKLGNTRPISVAFEVIIKPLVFEIISPKHAVSPVETFDVVITTDRKAECRYKYDSPLFMFEALPLVMSGNGTRHIIPNMTIADQSSRNVYLICRDEFGLDTEVLPAQFSVDMSPPSITSIIANPNDITTMTLTESGQWVQLSVLDVSTDESAVCKYGNNNSNYSTMTDWFKDNDNDNQLTFSTINTADLHLPPEMATYTYYAVCENLAGLLSAPQPISISVNLEALLSIAIVDPEDGYATNENNLIATIATNKPILSSDSQSKCWYGLDDNMPNIEMTPTPDGMQHSARIIGLQVGRHTINYRCQYFGEFTESTISFVMDTTPPSTPVVDAQNYTCFLDELYASWESEEDYSTIVKYEYAIGSRQGHTDIRNWTETEKRQDSVLAEDLNLTDKTTYYWSVRAENSIGLVSTAGTDSVYVDTDIAICREQVPPTVTLTKNVVSTGVEVTLTCEDTQSGCNTERMFYGLSLMGIECIPYESYNAPVIVDDDYTMCWQIYDIAGNLAEGEETIMVSEMITDADGDGVSDSFDNCPNDYNPYQTDSDFDGTGDACETVEVEEPTVDDGSDSDFDGDGILDVVDEDIDNDGIMNWEDPDDDNDGLCDTKNSPLNGDICTGEDSDDDEDGVVDRNERDTDNDVDNDGIDNGEDDDQDGDGLIDWGEDIDADNDGLKDYEDGDDDNDGIPDYEDVDAGGSDSTCSWTLETPNCRDETSDLDKDGVPNCEDDDMDGDGVVNWDDADDDSDHTPDRFDMDDDNNGIADPKDIDCNNDLDNDGLENEVDDDSDGDSISNLDDADDDNDGILDEIDEDDDNDGILDVEEILDSDGDGMPDKWEMSHGLNPYSDDSQLDSDEDLLVNIDEYREETDPRLEDTDGDGHGDGIELSEGFDPLDPLSYPKTTIWSTILLIIAIVIVLGGGSYVGVTEYKKKKGGKPPMRPTAPPTKISGPIVPTRPLSKSRVPLHKVLPSRVQIRRPEPKALTPAQKRLSELRKRRESQKQKERLKVFNEFDHHKKDIELLEEVDTKKTVVVKKPKEDKDWVPIDKLLAGKKDDFSKLKSVINDRGLHKEVKKAIKLPAKATKDDIFKKLDERLKKDKIPDDVFKGLDRVAKIKEPKKKADEMSKILSGLVTPDKKIDKTKVLAELKKEAQSARKKK